MDIHIGHDDGSIFVVERIALGDAIGPDGIHYGVIATKHNKVWPGTKSEVTFAVERYQMVNGVERPVETWGFFQEEDCYLFLTSRGRIKIDVWDRDGVKESVLRDGLKVPSGMVSREQYEV